MTRILVGTMYCGEPEFQAGQESLSMQTHDDWEQFVVENLPNKLAHETLYRGFMDRASDFDFFLKLDADMVFEDATKLGQIVAYFEANPNLDGISIPVHDFFTNDLIHGMHVYRSVVQWTPNDEDVFVDPVPVPDDRFRIGVMELAPAVSHCKDATPYSAFHYGLHRGLKAMESMRREGKDSLNAGYYFEAIGKTDQHFQADPKQVLALAVLGFEYAIANDWTSKDVDYQNESVKQIAAAFAEQKVEQLESEIQKLREVSPVSLTDRDRLIQRRAAALLRATGQPSWKSRLITMIPNRLRKWVKQRFSNCC